MSSITNLSNKKGTFRPAIHVACTFAILCLSYLMLLIPMPDDTLVFFPSTGHQGLNIIQGPATVSVCWLGKS